MVLTFWFLVSPAEKNRLWNQAETSAVSNQSQFTLHIWRSNVCIFAWILCKRVGKYGGRCTEERMGSFRVWKTQQASRGNVVTCCESSNWFWKICSISGFVYCIFFCGTNKIELKKLGALKGYSLCTAALFLAWELQTYFFPLNDAFTDWWNKHQEDSYWRKD